MSIGYDVLAGGAKLLQSGIPELSALKLYEASIVVFPMNQLATVTAVKSLAACADPRELTQTLHREHEFSRSKAVAAADALWKILQRRDDPAERLMDQLASFNELLRESK